MKLGGGGLDILGTAVQRLVESISRQLTTEEYHRFFWLGTAPTHPHKCGKALKVRMSTSHVSVRFWAARPT